MILSVLKWRARVLDWLPLAGTASQNTAICMKNLRTQKTNIPLITSDNGTDPTVFDQLTAVQVALCQEMEVTPSGILPESKAKLADWGRDIVRQLCRTICKPILKLRPRGKVDWRNFGRMVG